MQLSVLGSNGTYPTPGRPASGYLLRTPSTTIWIDAGSGTCAAMQAMVDPLTIDAVVISHVHPDHCTDLLAYYHLACYGPRRRGGVPVYAADLVESRLRAFLQAGDDHPFLETLAFVTVAGGDQVEVGDVLLRFADTNHPVPTVAVRAEWRNRALAYTSDTGPSREVTELAGAADVLVAEASYQGEEKPWPHHLTAREAGEMAAAAGVERLYLTHIVPGLDPNRSLIEAEAGFGRPPRLAVPDTTIPV